MKKFGLLGYNITYSLSPKIHTEYYGAKGIDASYELVDTASLSSVLDRLRLMDGFNVTQPYKQEILEYIDELRTDAGAVNTVKVVNGKLIGYNTDGAGFLVHIKELGKVADLKNKATLILGAGGAATAIVPVVRAKGAMVYIHNRSVDKAKALGIVADISKIKPQVIINCTTLGLKGEDCLPNGIDLSKLEFAYDTIYNPPETPFLKKAKKCGAVIANGYRMLECQAYEAIKIWLA
ncbi:MAG: shikimate dehydrogenase [Firmicutes bacterium]|nr:shikimate dehydrogenase [Bacillota bacterium]